VNSSELLRHAVELAHAGKKNAARDAFLRVVEDDSHNELAWMWLAGLVDSIDDQIIACENVLTINPSNEKARAYLEELESRRNLKGASGKIENKETSPQPKKRDPLEEAKYLEQDGKFDEALMIYKVEAAKAKDTHIFDEIYKKIIHIEHMQFDKIQYVSPRASIMRLSLTWPLLYLSLALVQVGLNPLSHPASYLWFAFPWVVLGSYLIAVAEVRSRHMIWKRLFLDDGDGTPFARFALGAIGWLMILIPFILIVVDSLNRLADFQIPPRLF
jgi:tetratricopeptide (TPR) repeat protein